MPVITTTEEANEENDSSQSQGNTTGQDLVTSSELSEKKTYQIKRGSLKRSLQSLPNVPPLEPAFKRRTTMEECVMSTDELDADPDEFDAEVSESVSSPRENEPPSNFSFVEQSPVGIGVFNGYRNTANAGPRKLVIKNFQKKIANRDELLTTGWAKLEDSITAIQEKRHVASSFEELYQVVHNLCDQKSAGELNERLLNKIRSHIHAQKTELCKRDDLVGSLFLVHVNNLWTTYCDQMIMIRSIFLFLDRTYVLQNQAVMSIWESGLCIFREEVMDTIAIQKKLVRELLVIIESERMGNQADRPLLRSLLRMLSNLQIYAQVFEKELLSSSQDLFSREGDTLSTTLEGGAYLRHVDRRLAEENERVDLYLDESSRRPLINITEQCLIVKHMETVIHRGLDALLDECAKPELTLLFQLFSRVKEGPSHLKNAFTGYIKHFGRTLVMDPERDKTMVEDLMLFKQKMDVVVSECFGNGEKFVQAARDAFHFFINTRPNKPAELVAKFMDVKLRSANKEASEEELDKIMDSVISLFRFIQGKDVFEAFYKNHLAKRLLLGRSASVDAEKAMLTKLKQECGAGFTHKLEGMFKDIDLSKDLNNTFVQHCAHEIAQGRTTVSKSIDFFVHVLTMGHWPTYDYVEACLPSELCTSLKHYQDFYVAKHNGRKLQWQHSLGQCVLKATFRAGCVKELQVSLYQAIVLLLFNDQTEWTMQQILNATKIDKKELIRTVVSLACAKVRVLNKSSKAKTVVDDDVFTVNEDLKEKLYRIKISQVQMKETEEEQHATEEQVNQDRQYQIDAAVVRIMKTRKSLTHQALISELFAQLRFPVRSVDLKTRIGSLIERDYLVRDQDDPNTYKYVT